MDLKFLPFLCCPRTGSALHIKIDKKTPGGGVEAGTLISDDGRYEYPVINAVPRFVDTEYYSNSFGYEWNTWPKVQFESENIGLPMEGHTTKMFREVTGFTEEEVRGKSVVEFGCGPGRFLDVVKHMGGTAIGIDLSLAVEAARKNFYDDPDVLIVQGDILNPPFRDESFDLGYSIGVLHHTPDPVSGFASLSRVVKNGGKVAACVYEKKGFYDFFSVSLFRKIHRFMTSFFGPERAVRIARRYAVFSANRLYSLSEHLMKTGRPGSALMGIAERYCIVVTHIPDEKWRILDTFDAITPFFASTHTEEEVRTWYKNLHFATITRTGWGTTSFVGTKQKQS